jgi:cytochrome bd-type quinol oxidase subunit 1
VHTRPSDQGTAVVEDPVTHLWRGTVALRVVTFLFALGNAIVERNDYERPWLAWAAVAAMALWSVFTIQAYSREHGRRPWIVVADVAITCGLMSLSPLIMTDQQFLFNVPLITTIWAAWPTGGAGALGG